MPFKPDMNKSSWLTKFKTSLLWKLIAGLSLLIILLASVNIYLSTNITSEILTDNVVAASIKETTLRAQETSLFFYQAANDTKILAEMPPVQGFIRASNNEGIDPQDDSSLEELISRLTQIFVSVAEERQTYTQLRLIDKNGKEVVRVDSDGRKTAVIENKDLQDKSDRYYFIEAMKLNLGEIYISPLDLNREGSPPSIEVPYKPVIRFAVPLFDSNGDHQGIVVTNVLAEKAINNLADNFSKGKIFLLDQEGFYLLNPDKNKEWGSSIDLNTGHSFKKDFPDISSQVLSGNTGFLLYKNSTFVYEPMFIEKGNFERFLVIVEEIPNTTVLAPVRNLTNRLILINTFMTLITIFGIGWLISKLINPLQKFRGVIKSILQGDLSKRVEIKSNDEIGQLAFVFNNLIEKLGNYQQDLMKQVKDRTQELEKFKLAVDAASDYIVITDPEGIVLYGNKAVETVTGYSVEEAWGKKAGYLWGGLMDKKYYQQLWKTVKEDKKNFVSEITNHRKSGQKYIASMTISPVLDEDKKVVFFVSIQRDITRDKEIDRMKTEFISLASHQLRTPLSAMKWFLEMLLGGDLGKLSKKQKEIVENIDQSNERMIALVNGLLNISRIESGRMVIDPKPTDLKKIIEEILVELKAKITAKKLKVAFSSDKTIREISVDPDLIREVYLNLLTNAVKYTPKNGEIKINLSKDDKSVIFKVSDNGLGIPKSDQENLFTRFHRGSNVVKTETEGTGLGLYLTKAIVESSQGKIWFESEEEKGSTFWVSLPLSGSKAKTGEVKITGEDISDNKEN